MEMQKMIYAVVSVKHNQDGLTSLLAGMKGLGGADLFAVFHDEIAAVTGEIERCDFTADKSLAIEYAGVIDALFQRYPVLPMRFGSTLESSGAILEMLVRNRDEFLQNLDRVENKQEFGLKIFCDSEKLAAELRMKSEAVLSPPADPGITISAYREYINKKLKEHRLEELLVDYADTVIAEITVSLALLCAESRFKKMASAKNIIDAVFLLDKDVEIQLVRSVQDLQNKHQGLNFILTGPWPPYNFVEIKIQ